MRHFLQAAAPLAEDFASAFIFLGLKLAGLDVRVAIALAIVFSLGQFAWSLIRKKPIGALQWMSLGLVIVMGGASLITHDPRFLMVKPSVIYVVVGATMLQPYWMRRYMPQVARGRIGDRPILVAGYVWAGLMLLTAALNAYVALTFTLAQWALFMAIFPLASKIALFIGQYFVFRAIVVRNVRSQQIATEAQPA